MKKRILIVALVAALLITIPASAKEKIVGERINIRTGDAFTFDADTPFYVEHGFSEFNPKDIKFKDVGFDLFIDDIQQEVDYLRKAPYKIDKVTVFLVRFIFNYPDGLSVGDYVFRGEWKVACHVAEELGWVPSCDDPDEWFIFYENEVIGTFE